MRRILRKNFNFNLHDGKLKIVPKRSYLRSGFDGGHKLLKFLRELSEQENCPFREVGYVKTSDGRKTNVLYLELCSSDKGTKERALSFIFDTKFSARYSAAPRDTKGAEKDCKGMNMGSDAKCSLGTDNDYGSLLGSLPEVVLTPDSPSSSDHSEAIPYLPFESLPEVVLTSDLPSFPEPKPDGDGTINSGRPGPYDVSHPSGVESDYPLHPTLFGRSRIPQINPGTQDLQGPEFNVGFGLGE